MWNVVTILERGILIVVEYGEICKLTAHKYFNTATMLIKQPWPDGRRVNRYVGLKRFNADAKEIQAAYLEAQEAERTVHSELWAAVEALRWGS